MHNPFYADLNGNYGFTGGGAYTSGDPLLDFMVGHSLPPTPRVPERKSMPTPGRSTATRRTTGKFIQLRNLQLRDSLRHPNPQRQPAVRRQGYHLLYSRRPVQGLPNCTHLVFCTQEIPGCNDSRWGVGKVRSLRAARRLRLVSQQIRSAWLTGPAGEHRLLRSRRLWSLLQPGQ